MTRRHRAARAAQRLEFRIWRGDAKAGEFRSYRVKAEEGMVVLDAMRTVQATQAGDLAVRWNCKAGKCGSCSAEINGMPKLMCMTRIDTLPADAPITVAPLRAFPVVRDLVTDVSFNYEKARTIPAYRPAQASPERDVRIVQRDVERLREFHKCIECFLCQDVCHVIRDHDENKPGYAGPRQFVKIAALQMHPLDTADRMPFLRDEAGLDLCNTTRCCTEVCPEGIAITDNAIIPLKERLVDRYRDPLARAFRLFSIKAR